MDLNRLTLPVTFNLDPRWKTDDSGERYVANYSMVVYDRETKRRSYHSLKTDDRRKAERKLFAYEELYRRGQFDPFAERHPSTTPTIAEAAALFLRAKREAHEHSEGKLSNGTIEQYTITLNRLERGMPPGALLRSVMQHDIVRIFFRKGIKPSSIDNDLSRSRQFFKWCKKKGLVKTNPAIGPRVKSYNSQRHDFLSKDEFRHLSRAIIDHHSTINLSVYPEGCMWLLTAAMLGCGAGLRRAEVCHLRWANVDLAHKEIHIRRGEGFIPKHGRERSVPINPMLYNYLVSLRGAHPDPEGYVVIGPKGKRLDEEYLSTRFSRLRDKAKLRKTICFHSLRHTFASWAVMDGVDLYTVKTWLGHSRITQTERYAHLSPKHNHQALHNVFADLMDLGMAA
jgi:integrase